ncbi:Card1-like endonuclease domain-containing protein [Roseateles sp. GG27B]
MRSGWPMWMTRQIKVEMLELTDAWDLEGITDTLVNWLDAQGDAADVALNVTGGTKPMAMAAQQAFAMAGKPVFYVHQQFDKILWLTPRRPDQALGNKLKLEPFLHAHGWEVINNPGQPVLSEALRTLTSELVLNVGSLGRALGALNWYAQDCDKKQTLEVQLDHSARDNPSLMALLQKFEAAGACAVTQGRLRFGNEAERFFCNGGWLEHHVVGVLNELRAKAGIQDLAAGLTVRSLDNSLKGRGGSNELDVVFLAHNNLHIIECKTGSFGDRDSAAPAVSSLIRSPGWAGSTRGACWPVTGRCPMVTCSAPKI